MIESYERISTDEFSKNSESSLHRIARIKQIKPPINLKEMLDLASDDNDPEYPIFRTPRNSGLSE